MFCPECGGKLVFKFGMDGSSEYICENCNIKISIYEEELKGGEQK